MCVGSPPPLSLLVLLKCPHPGYVCPFFCAQNPLIVPVKLLPVHAASSGGVTGVVFHPTQPWLLTAGGDHTLALCI